MLINSAYSHQMLQRLLEIVYVYYILTNRNFHNCILAIFPSIVFKNCVMHIS